jgi:hypothetical protein
VLYAMAEITIRTTPAQYSDRTLCFTPALPTLCRD